jgi:hypothetical protein
MAWTAGSKKRKAQGSKREEKDMSANTFELEMDGGLIPQKGRGSLTKSPWLKRGYAASNLGGWI